MPFHTDLADTPSNPLATTLGWLLVLALGVAAYAAGLGGQNIPSNGDELVYAHIARLTAASQQWLPLVSELDNMRNTKPPLLFWQAIVASNWGHDWQLGALRLPSLVYTLLVTFAIAWTVRLIRDNWRQGLIAACVYLAFFSTFRYGRPYLTSAPETFWLSLPMFALLGRAAASGHASLNWTEIKMPGWGAFVAFGLALGVGIAYKSFALIAPAATALWCGLLIALPHRDAGTFARITAQVGLSTLLALGIFALWFVLDPDPAAVWREFVVGENAGKFSDAGSYWRQALAGGGSSVWVQLFAYVANAALLAPVVLGLGWAWVLDWRASRAAPASTRAVGILVAWTVVWLLIFCIPSQRSARYVIPAMPAVAMLIALYWQRIDRGWFVATLWICAATFVVLPRIAWVGHGLDIASTGQLVLVIITAVIGGILVAAGNIRPAWTRGCAIASVLLFYALFDLTMAPLDGASGRFVPTRGALPVEKVIAVPTNFNGQFERFQFLLPGNDFVPYDVEGRAIGRGHGPVSADTLAELLDGNDLVVWGQIEPGETSPPCLPECAVLATRWVLKGRHQSGEINLGNFWYPQQWLFRREWLLMPVE